VTSWDKLESYDERNLHIAQVLGQTLIEIKVSTRFFEAKWIAEKHQSLAGKFRACFLYEAQVIPPGKLDLLSKLRGRAFTIHCKHLLQQRIN
jgi:hypothetical protein